MTPVAHDPSKSVVTYADAGVDIDRANRTKKRIKYLAHKTFTRSVLSEIGDALRERRRQLGVVGDHGVDAVFVDEVGAEEAPEVGRDLGIGLPCRRDHGQHSGRSGVVLAKQQLKPVIEAGGITHALFEHAYVDPPASFETDLTELRRVLEGRD